MVNFTPWISFWQVVVAVEPRPAFFHISLRRAIVDADRPGDRPIPKEAFTVDPLGFLFAIMEGKPFAFVLA